MPDADARNETHAATDVGAVSLILVAHGSTRRPEANAAVERQAAKIRAGGRFGEVRTGFLLGGETPEDAAAACRNDADYLLLVPFAMTDGILADDMRARVAVGAGRTPLVVAQPVGTHPDIADMAAELGVHALTDAGYAPATSNFVAVAHGASNDDRSRTGAAAHVARLNVIGGFNFAQLGMLEETPRLPDVLAGIEGPAAVVGLFATPGGHAVDDVPAAIRDTSRTDLIDAGPVGLHPRMTELILARAFAALSQHDTR